MRASFLYIVVLLCKIIKFICRFFGFLHRAPSAARSDCVRHPIRLRPLSDDTPITIKRRGQHIRV